MEEKRTICGADCGACGFRERCAGCAATGGRPFGGPCVAAECIRASGMEGYAALKETLLGEINRAFAELGLPAAEALYELPGAVVNLAFPLPGGGTAKLLRDENIYLGTRVAGSEPSIVYGAAADRDFILLCRSREDGSQPELLFYRRR